MAVLGGQDTYLDSGSAVVISGAFAVSAFRCSGLLCAVMANKGKGPAPRCSVPGGMFLFRGWPSLRSAFLRFLLAHRGILDQESSQSQRIIPSLASNQIEEAVTMYLNHPRKTKRFTGRGPRKVVRK